MDEKTSSQQANKLVLIPTDFSEVCDNAINHGVELAGYLNASVCILHVINRISKSQLKKENQDFEHIYEKLDKYKQMYEASHGVKIETLAREGSIFDVINETAAELKANIMVMGTHGKKGLQHLFGSFALKVVLDCPCPVVVVQKRTFGEGYNKIMFPVSNDLEVRQKVNWAVMISKIFHSEVILFQANESNPDLDNRLKIITSQITAKFDEKSVPYQIQKAAKTSDFADQVIEFSAQNKCDLIMVMTVPHVDVPGFSVADWDETLMFNEGEIPVMCINPTLVGNYYYEWITLY